MKAPTVSFHDQARIPPEKVRLSHPICNLQCDVHLRARQAGANASPEKPPLQFAAGALGRRIEFFEQQAQSSHPPTSATAADQLMELCAVEQTLDLCLRKAPSQLPDRRFAGKVEETPLDARTRNPPQ